MVKTTDLDFKFATSVICGTPKFFLPIPAFDQNGLGDSIDLGEATGQSNTMVSLHRDRIYLHNDLANSYEGLRGDGRSVIAINNVDANQAEQIYRKIKDLNCNLQNIDTGNLYRLLCFIEDQMELKDIGSVCANYIRTNMTPIGKVSGNGIGGWYKENRFEVCSAVYLPGYIVLETKSMQPQEFKNGAVAVRQVNGEDIVMDTSEFEENYRQIDGVTPIKVKDMAQIKTFELTFLGAVHVGQKSRLN